MLAKKYIFLLALVFLFAFSFVAYAQDEDTAATDDETVASDTAATGETVQDEEAATGNEADEDEATATDEEADENEGDTEEETATTEEVVSEEVIQDEEVSAEDLGVIEPRVLPDSPFYFLKDFTRGVGNFFTFNSVKKAERHLEQANERLVEAQKLAEKTGNEEIAAKAAEKYQETMEKVSERIETIKEKEADNPRFQNLMDKFTEDGFKQRNIIGFLDKKLEQAPDEVKERLQEAHDRFVEKWGETLASVDGDKIDQRINRITDKIEGSSFKPLKNLEVLKELEGKLPEQALPAIQRAQENALKRLKTNLENLPEEERKDKLERYLQNVAGNETRHLEILGDLRARDDVPEGLVDAVDLAKEKSLQRIKEKISSLATEQDRERYLKDLQTGDINKMEVLKQIENNLDPEEAKKLEAIKNRATDRLKANLDDPQKRQEILEKLRGDATQFQVIEELEDKLPEDKKEFAKELRERAFSNMEEKLNEIKDEDKKELYLKKISGDDPNQIEVLRTVQAKLREQLPEKAEAAGVLDRVIEKQSVRIDERVQNIKDSGSLDILRKRIEAVPVEAREEILRKSPELLQQIEQRREAIQAGTLMPRTDTGSFQAGQTGVANPASVHCQKQGGKIRIVKDEKGEHGICVFPEGGECEEWAFYRGECQRRKPADSTQTRPMIDSTNTSAGTTQPVSGTTQTTTTRERVCAQVITPARNIRTGECRIFNNSCLEEGWKADLSCGQKQDTSTGETKPLIDSTQTGTQSTFPVSPLRKLLEPATQPLNTGTAQ